MSKPRYRKKTKIGGSGKKHIYWFYRLCDPRLPKGCMDFCAKTQEELDQKIEAKKNELDKGLSPGKELFGDYVKIFFDKIHGKNLSSNTIDRYTGLFNNHIKGSYLARTKLKDVTGLRVQAFIDDLEAKGVKGKTISLIAGIIKPTIKYAVNQGKIATDFTSTLRLPSAKRDKSRSSRVLSATEIELFLECIKDDHVLTPLVITGINTGMRKGELRGLKWEDIDFDNRFINVNKSYDHRREEGKKEGKTKTDESNRQIPISEKLISVLKEQQLKQKEWKEKAGNLYHDQHLVFTKKNGDYLSSTTIDRHLRKASEAIGSDMINLHDLRHTFSNRIAQSTGELEISKTLLGHTNINTTSKHYRTVENSETKAAIDSMPFIE